MSESYSAEEVAVRVRRVREAEKLIPAHFAQRIGATPQQVNDWEAGRQRPGPKHILRMCQEFGVTSDYLLFGMVAFMPLSVAHKLGLV